MQRCTVIHPVSKPYLIRGNTFAEKHKVSTTILYMRNGHASAGQTTRCVPARQGEFLVLVDLINEILRDDVQTLVLDQVLVGISAVPPVTEICDGPPAFAQFLIQPQCYPGGQFAALRFAPNLGVGLFGGKPAR